MDTGRKIVFFHKILLLVSNKKNNQDLDKERLYSKGLLQEG